MSIFANVLCASALHFVTTKMARGVRACSVEGLSQPCGAHLLQELLRLGALELGGSSIFLWVPCFRWCLNETALIWGGGPKKDTPIS